jgi:hypothetical protein
VWQYGSDESKDPRWLQDGIAPQCRIEGLDDIQYKSGRAYIPSGTKQGFYDSHKIGNYDWIFNLKNTHEGYVKPRK